jgi:hypothetical protein
MQDVPGTKTDIDIVQGSKRGLVRVVAHRDRQEERRRLRLRQPYGTTYKGGEFSAVGRRFYGI